MRTIYLLLLLCAGSAQAQSKWEYATVEGPFIGNGENQASGSCTIRVATSNGFREENVQYTEPVSEGKRSWGRGFALAQNACSAALTRMGEQGWELVSVLGSEQTHNMRMFFKRPKSAQPTP